MATEAQARPCCRCNFLSPWQLAIAGWGAIRLKGWRFSISAEDEADELHRRLDDIARHEDVGFSDLDRLTLRSLAGEDALFARFEAASGPLMPSALCEEVDTFLSEQRPTLLVLDTLADLFPGNENDKAQVRQFMNILKGLAIRHDCAVVVLAHPSRAGMSTGSGDSGNVA